MKLRAFRRFAGLVPASASAALVVCGVALGADPVPITVPTISPVVPTEVVDGAGAVVPVAVSALPMDFFDDFSWRSFLALSWPSKPDVRGVADAGRAGTDLSGPRVWETWKSAFEAVPAKGAEPTVWSSFDGKTPCAEVAEAGSGKTRVLGSFTKFGDISQADFGSLAGPLVSQNRRYLHYEVKVNEPEFNVIRTNKLYERSVIDGLTAPVVFTNGSIEVKAAWREFRDDEGAAVRSRYYRTQAHVQNYTTSNGEVKELGLVGLHIVQKTPLRPQWVWSSFEHVDNVPPFGQSPSIGTSFALNDPSKPQVLDPDPGHAPVPVTDATYLTTGGEPVHPPMQVVRTAAIQSKTLSTNTRYQHALAGSVWANYMLVMTQWPTDTATPDGVPFPDEGTGTVIANTSMETYFQNSTSCMSCPSASQASNLDFVFFPLVHASNRDPGPPGSRSRVLLESLRLKFNDSRQRTGTAQKSRLGVK